jgi:hypothetical protein
MTITLEHARELQRRADETGDAELYRQAAAEYRALGMECNAAACDRRAAYYRKDSA